MVARGKTEVARDTLVGLFKGACEVYTTDDFMVFVATGTVPDGLMEVLAGGVARYWSALQGVGEPEILEALREAKPEVAEIIVSPQGREWAAKLAGRLTMLVPLRMMSQLFV
jgi:hypothetical protein